MKLFLHLITLAVTVALAVSGFLAWRFGLQLIESQTFHYDGVAEGEIIRAKAEDAGDHVSPGLRYVFEAAGHVVYGKYYRQNLITKKELSQARAITAAHKPGSKVKVYYRLGAGVSLYLAVVVLGPRKASRQSEPKQSSTPKTKEKKGAKASQDKT